MPVRDEAVDDVRVGSGELFRDGFLLALEHQHRAIDGICERSGNDQLATLMR